MEQLQYEYMRYVNKWVQLNIGYLLNLPQQLCFTLFVDLFLYMQLLLKLVKQILVIVALVGNFTKW